MSDRDSSCSPTSIESPLDTSDTPPNESSGDVSDGAEDAEAVVLAECNAAFTQPDYIMEPQVFGTLSKYFQVGGQPEPVIAALSDNYVAVAQLCNLVGGWLVDFEEDKENVRTVFEHSLSALVLNRFNTQQADHFFYNSTATDMEWLAGLIEHKCWRQLIYTLAENTPDCLLLNFAVKLCSDAGFQDEICNVNTAAQQLEVFSRVLRKSFDDVLSSHAVSGSDTRAFKAACDQLVATTAHSHSTYLYAQAVLHCLHCTLSQASNGTPEAVLHISQMLSERTLEDGKDNTSVSVALLNTRAQSTCTQTDADTASTERVYDAALPHAMFSMILRNTLNPADMMALNDTYRSSHPPPLNLIRQPRFLDLCIDSLFRPNNGQLKVLQPERRRKYIHLLAYATSVWTYPEGTKRRLNMSTDGQIDYNKDDLHSTEQLIEEMSDLCQGRDGRESTSELLGCLDKMFQAIKCPVVAMGVLHWVSVHVNEPQYFVHHAEPVPIHLALLDELASTHCFMHSHVFACICGLFVRASTMSAAADSGAEKLLERQRTFIDRLVHLLSCGYTLPVLEFVLHRSTLTADKNKTDDTNTTQATNTPQEHLLIDTSLVRYFVCEVLDMVAPPYSKAFTHALLPLVQNKCVIDDLVQDKTPAVKTFLDHCLQCALLSASHSRSTSNLQVVDDEQS